MSSSGFLIKTCQLADFTRHCPFAKQFQDYEKCRKNHVNFPIITVYYKSYWKPELLDVPQVVDLVLSFFIISGQIMQDLAKELLVLRPSKFKPKHTRNLMNEFACFVNYETELDQLPADS